MHRQSARASMGPGKGKAAVFRLPHRVKEVPPRFMPGDPRFPGSWRIYSDRLRALVVALTNADTRLLVCHVLPCDRAKDGTPANSNLIVRLGGKEIADTLPGMSPRTANRAAANLAALGLLKQALESEGRRPTMFWLDGDAVAGVARGSRKVAASPRRAGAPTTWSIQGCSQMARKVVSSNGKLPVSGQSNSGKTALRAKGDTLEPVARHLGTRQRLPAVQRHRMRLATHRANR
jgi:hypothetical protein